MQSGSIAFDLQFRLRKFEVRHFHSGKKQSEIFDAPGIYFMEIRRVVYHAFFSN